ncbi:lipocalin-like domain-containing protein [Hymenobacter ruricola]|uniref:Lipocalin family protein n=1 Tax=Hymenobacter ruricola TaxID=2791023 RepID=A0ABS0I0D5_9BACT|nr:lipocalin family protein [Hymenobacter ruricola]MBF9220251.1 lipocalin family protein [Hymenobacter ruricola]
MKTLSILLLSGLLVTSMGCKKDKEDAPAPSKTAMLTAGTWKVNSSTLTIDAQSNTFPEPSSNQAGYKFNTDGKTVVTYSDGTTGNGTWALQNNDSELVLKDGSSAQQTRKVFELTSQKLSIGRSFDKTAIQKVLNSSSGADFELALIVAGNPSVAWQNTNNVDYKINYTPK